MEKSNVVTTTEHKLTAAQVEDDCPVRLRQIGKEIGKRLEKAERQAEGAQNHLIAIDQLLAEAKELCDGGGFDKFRELFCPQLGKSQTYVLLAIAAGKKTLAEHRAEERQRKQKTRAKQKAAAANSGTVPEKSGSEVAPAAAPSIVPPQTPEPAKPRRSVSPKDEACYDFTARTMDIVRRIKGKEVERFAGTSVTADVCAYVGKFYTELAKRKKFDVGQPTAPVVLHGNDATSAEQNQVKI